MRKKWNHAAMLFLCLTLAVLLARPAYAAFSDVPESHWAAADIQYVTERGLFTGTSATTFEPNANMNRAMLATVLYRYAGSPEVAGTVPYIDVEAGQWYTDGVTWAYQNGIFTEAALGWTQLNPASNVRRAEFSVMLYNFANTLGKGECNNDAMEQQPFTDMDFMSFSMAGFGPVYNESVEAMLGWAWPNGIVTGTSATTLNPLGTITRAEVAAMLGRFDRNVLGGTVPTVTIQPDPDPEPSPEENQYEGYTLTNGKPLSEENVYEILMELKETYPSGTLYGAPYVPNNPFSRPYSNCDHCAGWAMLCSDAAFGNMPWIRKVNPTWEEIRVGDLVDWQTDSSGHVVVALKKAEDYIIVTESGNNNKTTWGGQYFCWWLEEQPGYAIYTRYPS